MALHSFTIGSNNATCSLDSSDMTSSPFDREPVFLFLRRLNFVLEKGGWRRQHKVELTSAYHTLDTGSQTTLIARRGTPAESSSTFSR